MYLLSLNKKTFEFYRDNWMTMELKDFTDMKMYGFQVVQIKKNTYILILESEEFHSIIRSVSSR